jgi:cytochrome c oxidase subunit I
MRSTATDSLSYPLGVTGTGIQRVRELPDHSGLALGGFLRSPAGHCFILSMFSLLLSGVFAVFLVVARIPAFSQWVGEPEFFRRCLVLHVNLSLLIWFCAFTASLFCIIPGAGWRRAQVLSFLLSATGTLAMVVSPFLRGSTPVLSNYIPFIHHWLFACGLVMFLGGLGLLYCSIGMRRLSGGCQGELLGRRCSPSLPFEVRAGVQASAAAFLVALATIIVSWLMTPRSLDPAAYYEFVAWGGGHVLQVAHVAAMAAVWLWLLRSLLGVSVLGKRAAVILFSLLLLPHMVSPALAIGGTVDGFYYRAFTHLMRYGIFPSISVLIGVCLWRLLSVPRGGDSPAFKWWDFRMAGFSISALLALSGFVLGAMIRGSTTLVPAHYHAAVGAVTVAFMAAAYLLIERNVSNGPLFQGWLMTLQLWLFGGGKLLFAGGFAIGGFFGLGRKIYGSEQEMISLGERCGLILMGIGGFFAVTGGLLFLWIVLGAMTRSIPYGPATRA